MRCVFPFLIYVLGGERGFSLPSERASERGFVLRRTSSLFSLVEAGGARIASREGDFSARVRFFFFRR